MQTLKYDIENNGLEIPYAENTNILLSPFSFYNKTFVNRVAIFAQCGGDATSNGEFSIYSRRRYARLSGEGAGIIFTEPVAISEDKKRFNNQLCLNEHTLSNFKSEIDFFKNLSVRENGILPYIILKLDLYGDLSDKKTSGLLTLICFMAEKAGFDGIALNSDCDELRHILLTIKSNASNKFLFALDFEKIENMAEKIQCLYDCKNIFENFVVTVNLNCDQKNLELLNRNISFISSVHKRISDVIFLTYGYSGLGYECGNIASGVIESGICDIIGFIRQAEAYPSFVRDLAKGGLDKNKCCTLCGKCEQLYAAGLMSGCVVFDSETYMSQYKKIMD